MTETIYLPDTDGGEGPETWPAPKHWRVCAQGHLVTDKINSYKVQRGNGVTTFACKSCQLAANERQRGKDREEEIFAEHTPGPDEKPGELPVGAAAQALSDGDPAVLKTRLDQINAKLDELLSGPNTFAKLQQRRIDQLEKELAELKKGPALEDMTFDQLKAKAAELGIEVPKGARSAGVRKLIEEHSAAPVEEVSPEDVEDAARAAVGDPEDASDEPELDAATVEPAPEEDPAVELQHEGIVEAASGEEVEGAPRRHRRRRLTEEEIDAKAQEVEERRRRRSED